MGKYDFTDLILLVGTNPLPNYVVGKFFLRENKDLEKIWLVYTSQTEKYADNLEKELKIEKVNIEKRSLSSEASAFKIRKEFREGVLNNLKGKTIHLNYTGGTKSMSVHTYIATLKESIEISENELDITATYSYLNARGFNIYRDDLENPITGDLRKEVDLNFKTLLDLHGYKRDGVNDIYKQSLLPVIQEIEKVITETHSGDLNGFKKYTRIYSNESDDKTKLISNQQELPDHILDFPSKRGTNEFTPTQKRVLQKLPNNLKVYNSDGKANKALSNEEIKYAISFLDGKWLEMYVEYVINKYIKNQINKFKIDVGWEIRDPDWSQAKNDEGSYKLKFELDVIMLNGYQLFGISCTTASNRPICKSKGFEILRRSKQIGGDEAKSILVTNLYPNPKDRPADKLLPKDLQDEIEIDNGMKREKNNKDNKEPLDILVLGSNDLKPHILAKKIEDFIKK